MKILTITIVLILLTLTLKAQYVISRNNPTNTTTEQSVTNSPGNMLSNSKVVVVYRDSTYYKTFYPTINFAEFGSSRNDGTPTSILWADIDGWLRRSPFPTMFSGVYNDLTSKPNLSLYYLATNPSGYISSYTETDPQFNTKFSGKTTTDLTEGISLYFTNARSRLAISSAQGLSYNSSTGVMSTAKKQETFSGSTNSSGVYAVTFPIAYSVAPNIQANLIAGTNKMTWIVTVATTGFSILVQSRADVLGLLPSYSNVNAQVIDVIVTEK